jgi:hypothetical protein
MNSMNKTMPLLFDEKGWYLKYLMPKEGGGLVLQEVMHDGYYLAKDIRVVRIWVGTEDPGKSQRGELKDYVLGSQEFPCLADPMILPAPKAPTEFPFYKPVAGIECRFETAEAVFGKGTEKLKVTQQYLFTAYGKDPPHEPGHVLDAARLFPRLCFDYLPGKSEEKAKTPKYLRVDYRIHLSVDKFLDQKKNLTRVDNQAGIFRDNEHLPGAVFDFASPILFRGPHLEEVFAAAEKPLQYEVIGPGLIYGQSEDPNNHKEITWDNIHWWASQEKGELPSTPGAFHAAHIHWRWAAVSGEPGVLEKKILPGGEQFKGLNWTKNRGGPLLDPRIPVQSIRFAIAKDSPKRTAQANPSNKIFDQIFVGEDPAEVDKGTDLVLWISIDIFRDNRMLKKPWEGALFVHGLYFAHDPEPTIGLATLIEGRKPLLKPKPKRKWVRLATEEKGS